MVAFIGNSSVSLSGERGRPPHDEVERSHLRCRFWPHLGQSAAMVDHSRGMVSFRPENASNRDNSGPYQLRLKPALKLLLAAPDGVSPIEPEMVTPSNSFCSAPTLRSHLSSEADRVWPAIRLVPDRQC
jgi:hypothetical protein